MVGCNSKFAGELIIPGKFQGKPVTAIEKKCVLAMQRVDEREPSPMASTPSQKRPSDAVTIWKKSRYRKA